MTFIKNEKGVISPVLIIVALIVVAGIGFAGYKVMSDKKAKTDTAENATTVVASKELNAECLKMYNDKDLCKFMSNWQAGGSYKATFASVSAEGKASSMKIEADGDNTSSVILDGDKETAAYITLNKVTYMKDYEKNVWYKMPTADTGTPAAETNPVADLDFTKDEGEAEAVNTTTYKSLGKEACGSKNCFKYQIIDTSDVDTLESFIWFDDGDYKMARWMTKSKDGSSSDSTFSYEKVTITEPSPVEDYPSLDPTSMQ